MASFVVHTIELVLFSFWVKFENNEHLCPLDPCIASIYAIAPWRARNAPFRYEVVRASFLPSSCFPALYHALMQLSSICSSASSRVFKCVFCCCQSSTFVFIIRPTHPHRSSQVCAHHLDWCHRPLAWESFDSNISRVPRGEDYVSVVPSIQVGS